MLAPPPEPPAHERPVVAQLRRERQLVARRRRDHQRWIGRWGIAGEVFRIVVDPDWGEVRADEVAFGRALVAGLLAELMLAGAITCTEQDGHSGLVTVAGAVADADRRVARPLRQPSPQIGAGGAAEPPVLVDEPVQAWLLDRVAAASRHDVRHWLVLLSAEVFDRVAHRLVAAGVMEPIEYRTRVLRRVRKAYAAVDGYATAADNARAYVPRLITERRALSDEDVVLAALLAALGWSRRIRRESVSAVGFEQVLGEYLPQLPLPLQLLVGHAQAAIGRAAIRVV